jgi:hypothetical protein
VLAEAERGLTVTTNQVLAGVGLILVLAVAFQPLLMPVTRTSTPAPQSGDTMILLEPVIVSS